MEHRQFGASDLTVSTIGFGTWPIGGARYGPSDDEDAIRAVHAALDAGITCFDTAPSYGNGHAETLLGQALGERRNEVTVVTKGGLVWDEDSTVLAHNSRPDHLASQIDDSLRRLGTDHIDLYLIHWPDTDTPLAETMGALEGFVEAGKARAIGVSNFTGAQVRTCHEALIAVPLTANQVSFNLFDRRWERDAFDTCRELGVGVMAYGPLAHGLLAGALTRETTFDPSDWRSKGNIFGQPLLTPGNFERNLDVVERLKAIAEQRGVSLPQLAIAWVLANPAVTLALVGARNDHEIAEAATASEIGLTPGEMDAIDEVMRDAAGTSSELSQ